MVSHWNLYNSKSHQVSRTLLSILADLNNAVVWMVSTRPLISKSSSSCTIPLVTVPKAQITTGISVTFIVHMFFNSQVRSMYLPFSLSFNFALWSAETAKSTILKIIIIIMLLLFFGSSFTQTLNDGFPIFLRYSKFFQVSRTLLIILADLNNAVIWMVSDLSSDFQLFHAPFKVFRYCSKCAN